MSGLWDYDEPDLNASVGGWNDKGPSSAARDAVIEEDDEGNGRARRGRPTKKARKLAKVMVVDDDDLVEIVDSDDDFRLAPRGGLKSEEDSILGSQPCNAAAAAAAPCKPAAPVSAAETFLDESTRQAMAMSKRLAAELVAVSDDPEDDIEPLPMLPQPRLGSLRMMSYQNTSSLRTAAVEKTDSLVEAEAQALLEAEEAEPSGSSPAAAPEAGADKVTIVCQCKCGDVSIKTRKTDSFAKLQKSFLGAAVAKGWLTEAVAPPGFKFMFDGDKVGPDDTPEGLEMDDGERLDVSWKQ